MKKAMKKVLTLMLAMAMTVILGGISVFAANDAKLDDAGITYTVTIYSGDSGTFTDGSTVKKMTGCKYGEAISISIDSGDYKTVVKDSVADKYYVRGLKPAGHDNDETSSIGFRTINTTVTGDASYTVAYGIKGGMVKYTVNYVDENGAELYPSAEYYGMAGDYPVVSFQYIEGYAPNAYNLGKTLSSDESENVFTFTYSESTLTAEEQQAAATQPAGRGAGAGAGATGANGNGAANADGTAIGDNVTPLSDAPNVVDLDDGNVPQSESPEEGRSWLTSQKILGCILGAIGVIAIIALLAVLIAKRRRSDDENEDEDEE